MLRSEIRVPRQNVNTSNAFAKRQAAMRHTYDTPRRNRLGAANKGRR